MAKEKKQYFDKWMIALFEKITFKPMQPVLAKLLMDRLKLFGHILTIEQKEKIDILLERLSYDPIETEDYEAAAEQTGREEILNELQSILKS